MGFEDAVFPRHRGYGFGLLDTDHPFVHGITIEQLDREHFVRAERVKPRASRFYPSRKGGFGTPSGSASSERKLWVHFTIEDRGWVQALRSPRYPLELISSKSDDSMNSTFGNRPGTDAQTAVLASASRRCPTARDCTTGDRVRAFNDRGSRLLQAANVDGVVRAGVARAPSVRWNNNAQDASNVNCCLRPPHGHGGRPHVL